MNPATDIDRERLLALIPHAGSMCLLDRVTAWSEQGIECTTGTHRDRSNPLRDNEQLHAVHLIEYAAQATAVHGALLGGGARPGMLASLRDVRIHAGRIDTIAAELTVRATRRLAQPDGSLYDFGVYAEDRLLCEGRIAIALH